MAKFLKWIVNIILLCSIVVAGALLVPPLAGVTTVMVDEVDMKTNLAQGSVTYAKEVAVAQLEVGDQILVSDDGDYVYRVKNVDTSDGSCVLEDTRTPNSQEIKKTFRNAVSRVFLSVPFIGYIPMAMKSTEGLIVIGLAVVFVVILFVLAELWRPDEEEDDEEAEEESEENPQPAAERTLRPVDVSSIIMEEASNEIASAVSSVVAGEQMENEKALQEEAEAAENEEAGPTAEEQAIEREILNYEDMYDEETTEIEEAQENIVGTDDIQDTKDIKPEELIEEAAAKAEAETAEATGEEEESEGDDEEAEDEMAEMETERELAMPLYTAQELIIKAKEKGEEPEIIQDGDTGVTILDYSNLL